jgi:hypothetical protein
MEIVTAQKEITFNSFSHAIKKAYSPIVSDGYRRIEKHTMSHFISKAPRRTYAGQLHKPPLVENAA